MEILEALGFIAGFIIAIIIIWRLVHKNEKGVYKFILSLYGMYCPVGLFMGIYY